MILRTSPQRNFWPTGPKKIFKVFFSGIIISGNTYNEMQFLHGWLGQKWNYRPEAWKTSRGSPFLPAGPSGPWAKMGTLVRFFMLTVCNSISALVTHAEITHWYTTHCYRDALKTLSEPIFTILIYWSCQWYLSEVFYCYNMI